MYPIIIKFDADINELIRTITIRQYCNNELSKKEALKIAVKLIEEAHRYNIKEYGKFLKDQKQSIFMNLPYHVSFTLLYKTREEANDFMQYALEMLKNYNNL